MASLDNPSTWNEWGKIDGEFVTMKENGTQPRFPTADQVELSALRRTWAEMNEEDMAGLLAATEGRVVCDEIQIPLPGGVKTRGLVFKPTETASGGSPLAVVIHGGGFIFGTADMEASTCINVAKTYGCVCISIEHRLAPEVKFPVAFEDCWNTLQWIAANASTFGADPSKGFILGGCSSGGQLTASLSHWARDRGLAHPLTGVYLNSTSICQAEAVPERYKSIYQSREQNSGKTGLSEEQTNIFHDAVQPDTKSGVWNPLIWENGHQGLPRTYFQVCGADIQRDDSLIYERVLRQECGTETKVDMYPGLPHVFWYFWPTHSVCGKYYEDTVQGFGWLLGI